MEPFYIKNIKFSAQTIIEKRLVVRNLLIKKSKNINSGEIVRILNDDVAVLFDLYDTYFLDDYFKKYFRGTLLFSLSTRMTYAAGKTIVLKNLGALKIEDEKYEIRMGVNFFLAYNEIEGEKNVSGIQTKDALEAFQIVFEHELCHLIEFYLFKASSCKQDRFKTLANNIFGHTGIYHSLPTKKEIARKKYDLHVGEHIIFDYQNKKLSGFIHGIKKRATVMVLDKKGSYADKKGNRYMKYYVPLEALKKK
ncbi:hypothetical protein [Marinisporobacter balticus]|uniref:SprT-like family protein n=1 Tax=Marinisporobacter balticus TaxID=2018667 RepID=A0A4R2KM39_9FIRM|nr:hypothetical protein [Marinisporobacter balticus]TCO74753.1 hypothetical protein EV214_11115 [Marinisporobacter balticus]